MAALDNSSGRQIGTKTPKHVNTRAKAVMMVAVDRHRKCVPSPKAITKKSGQKVKNITRQCELWGGTSAE
jgi:hypothetical protein